MAIREHPRSNARGAHVLGDLAKPPRRRGPQRRKRRRAVERIQVNG